MSSHIALAKDDEINAEKLSSENLNSISNYRKKLSTNLPSIPTYGSCISSPTAQQQYRVTSPTQLLLSLMGSVDSSDSNNNNNTSSPTNLHYSASDSDQEDSSINSIVEEEISNNSDSDNTSIEEQPTTNTTSIYNNKLINMVNWSVFTPLLNRFLNQTVLADKLNQYFILVLLSQNGKYAALGFIVIYIIFTLLIWIPLWLLSCVITETGVYLFILTSIIYGGRCILRLLAFPGTNVKVYGEIENEFSKYACKMLSGGADALSNFAMSIRAGNSSSTTTQSSKMDRILGKDDNDGWDIQDVASTYKRLEVYKKRVFGVYLEVLHCLLEENGQGYDPSSPTTALGAHTTAANGNSFYRLGENISACKDTCKRSMCCERQSSSGGETSSETIQINVPPAHSPTNSLDSNSFKRSTTKYGNNPLVGDVGNMNTITSQARSDGRELYTLLTSLLEDYSTLESSASNILQSGITVQNLKKGMVSNETAECATKLIQRAEELRELVSRIKLSSPDGDNEEDEQEDDEEDVGAEAVRHRLEEQGTASSSSTMGMVKSAIQAFVSMIDPPPHKSIFGLDVIRGCFLARYIGARQFWIKRSRGGGKLDVIHIPSLSNNKGQESFLPLSPRKGRDEDITNNSTNKRRAVLYCNPNAGLVEVATGMGLTGGNVAQDKDDDEKDATCWTEYYIEHGYDVYLFNYAGYGRSFGGSSWNETTSEFNHGFFPALRRVFFSTFLAFKPSSESLKSDASIVAQHLVDVVGVDELIIHGESIGGLAAAGAARSLTATTASPKVSTLLICDRTFCNLEAVAQRLVGGWTGNAIRLLTPTWSTDVARDFIAARCPKVVAQDAADEIIHDYSSLKTGLSFAKELTKGSTKNIGWMMSSPLEYRMADLDSVSITDSRLPSSSNHVKNPSTWPADKHISCSEAHHFSACVRRIGKLATAAKKQIKLDDSTREEEGTEVILSSMDEVDDLTSPSSVGNQKKSDFKALIKVWKSLACIDGLCGLPLGHTVKEGSDCTIAWLCCVVIFGSQRLASQAEKRWSKDTSPEGSGLNNRNREFLLEDFDMRPTNHHWDDSSLISHPLPIPVVLSSLKNMTAEEKHSLKEGKFCGISECACDMSYISLSHRYTLIFIIPVVEAELKYVIGMLEYIVSRLTSKESVATSISQIREGVENDQDIVSTGCFLNLNCGHNNQYSSEEREKLISLIRRSFGSRLEIV